ncbi:MAG: response regulator [Planctomycetales bacterium]|nr:response regulator [Planctomycetales bacterium]
MRAIVDGAPHGMVMIDPAGAIVLVNSRLERDFGYSREEMIGHKVEMLVPVRFRSGHKGHRDSYFSNPATRSMGEGRDLYGQRKDGTEFPVELGLNPIHTDEGLFVLGAVVDITERKAAEDKLRAVTQKLEKQNWLKSGHAELADVMRGRLELDDLSKSVVTFLAKYTGASVGVLYLSEGDALVLRGTYAYSKRKRLATTFAIGEGIVGQAARERETILISDVPEDYITIGSGLGECQPRQIVVVPIIWTKKLEGVLELGTLTEFTDAHLELLRSTAEYVGVAITTSRERGRTEELLQTTQSQANELQVQQAELEAANAELEEKSHELQAQQEELEATNSELEEQSQQLKDQQAVLQKANDELTARSRSLVEQRNELQKAKTELQSKAMEIEQASKYKSEFLANMSHELRTPLNSVLILAQNLAENAEGNLTEHQVKSAEVIQSGGRDLLNLINDILDLSKVEAGRLDVHFENISVQRMLENVRSQFVHIAQKKGLQFDVAIGDGVSATLVTDSQRCEQVLKNLLSNAFKFTANGSVCLSIAAEASARSNGSVAPASVAFTVSDTGIGIPVEKQNAIFDAFQQADGSISRKYGGTGLGLTISRELAKLLEGKLSFQSTPGEGSSFTLVLPLAPKSSNAASPPETNDANNSTILDPVRNSINGRGRLASANSVDDRDSTHPGDRSIVIIEDDSNFASLLVDECRARGFKCLVAGTGREGIQLVSRFRPEAVILDLGLPDTDGVEVLDQLKLNLATRHIPVHVLSGMDAERETSQRGAIGYLRKPVSAEELEDLLTDIQSFLDKRVKHILIVEDDNRNRAAVVQLLSRKGVEISDVATGQAALDHIESHAVDCIVLDLGLPDMTGQQFLDHLSSKATNDIPVIIYTGKELSNSEHRQLREHTDTIVVKGADSPERLMDEVSLFLHSVERDLSTEQRRVMRMLHDTDQLLASRKVLLVDDDMRNLFALSSVLRHAGLDVVKAGNGQEALDHLDADDDIELVIMDVMMPVMNGIQAIELIRNDSRLGNVPIIALTAKAMPDDRVRCMNAGATEYLSKPVDVDKLLNLIKVWISDSESTSHSLEPVEA